MTIKIESLSPTMPKLPSQLHLVIFRNGWFRRLPSLRPNQNTRSTWIRSSKSSKTTTFDAQSSTCPTFEYASNSWDMSWLPMESDRLRVLEEHEAARSRSEREQDQDWSETRIDPCLWKHGLLKQRVILPILSELVMSPMTGYIRITQSMDPSGCPRTTSFPWCTLSCEGNSKM